MNFVSRNKVRVADTNTGNKNLSSPFFVIQPARRETSCDANTMTMQFDISGGRGV
jgi:hypothetical protein